MISSSWALPWGGRMHAHTRVSKSSSQGPLKTFYFQSWLSLFTKHKGTRALQTKATKANQNYIQVPFFHPTGKNSRDNAGGDSRTKFSPTLQGRV